MEKHHFVTFLLPDLRGTVFMWQAVGYFDESTDESEECCYTIAGYVGAQLPAVVLDLRWKSLLCEYNLEYFKASEIEFGFGQFAQYRDDPNNLSAPLSKREKQKIKEIKTAFVDAICNEDHLLGMSASVILRDFHLLKENEPELAKKLPDKPYMLCGQLVLMEAGRAVNWSNNNFRNKALLRPVFDSHKDYSFRFRSAFDWFCIKNPTSSQFLLPPIYETEQTYRCLQAADCLAYEARRLVDKKVYDPEDSKPDRVAIQRLRDQMSAIYYLDYKGLKMLAENQKPQAVYENRLRSV